MVGQEMTWKRQGDVWGRGTCSLRSTLEWRNGYTNFPGCQPLPFWIDFATVDPEDSPCAGTDGPRVDALMPWLRRADIDGCAG